MKAFLTKPSLLDELLDPVSACFTPETARALVASPPNEGVRARMAELGRKAEAGTLAVEQARDYQTFVAAGDFVAALQLQARQEAARRRPSQTRYILRGARRLCHDDDP